MPVTALCQRDGELERETGFEPATNSLEGCDSTPELLPPMSRQTSVLPITSCRLGHLICQIALLKPGRCLSSSINVPLSRFYPRVHLPA